jgi:hypothetical protein
MKSAENAIVYGNPVVSELNRVPNFDPLKFLRKTDNGPKLDLRYKKLWFRLKYPNGRIKLSPLRITDQLAIIEARVFFDRKDSESVANYTVLCQADSVSDGRYVEMAQDLATDKALSDAGFGIQFASDEAKIIDANIVRIQGTNSEARNTVKVEVKSVSEASTMGMQKAAQANEQAEKKVESGIEKADVSKQAAIDMSVKNSPNDKAIAPANVSSLQNVVSEAVIKDSSDNVPISKEAADNSNATSASAPAYTKEMSVEEICSVMSLEEAENYVVTSGTCSGMKVSQVAERRMASLRFYINGYSGDDNILRAAATLVLASRNGQTAA